MFYTIYASGRSDLNIIFNAVHTYRTSDWGGKMLKDNGKREKEWQRKIREGINRQDTMI